MSNQSPNTLFRNNTINGILSIFQNQSSKRNSNNNNDGGSSDDDDDSVVDDIEYINNGTRGIKVFSAFCKTTNKNKILHVNIYNGNTTIDATTNNTTIDTTTNNIILINIIIIIIKV